MLSLCFIDKDAPTLTMDQIGKLVRQKLGPNCRIVERTTFGHKILKIQDTKNFAFDLKLVSPFYEEIVTKILSLDYTKGNEIIWVPSNAQPPYLELDHQFGIIYIPTDDSIEYVYKIYDDQLYFSYMDKEDRQGECLEFEFIEENGVCLLQWSETGKTISPITYDPTLAAEGYVFRNKHFIYESDNIFVQNAHCYDSYIKIDNKWVPWTFGSIAKASEEVRTEIIWLESTGIIGPIF